MQPPSHVRKSFIENLLIFWVYLCVILFIVFPGSVSIIHNSTLVDIQYLPLRLINFQIFSYFTNVISSALEIFLFCLACTLTGSLFVWLTTNEEREPWNEITHFSIALATSFLIGHWVLSSTFLTLAYLGRLTPSAVILTLCIGSFFGLYSIRRQYWLFLRNKQFNLFETSLILENRLIKWLSLSILFLGLLYSASRLSYDSVNIYFSDPKLTALTHQLQFFREYPIAISSYQTSIQYAAIMQLFSDQAARMYSWIGGCIFIIFSIGIAKKVGLSGSARWILFILIITTTAFTDLLGDGKVDLVSSASAIAVIYWLIASTNKNNHFLTGFFVGLAMVLRLYNFFLLSSFITVFYLTRVFIFKKVSKYNWPQVINSGYWIAIGAITPIAFNLLCNWVIFGSPLAIFANAQNITAEGWQWSFDRKEVWMLKALYPAVVTFLTTPQSLGTISPLFLAALPALFLPDIRKKLKLSQPLVEILLSATITLLLWLLLFFTFMEIRYIFFIWAILFLPVAIIINFMLESKNIVFLNLFVIILVVLLGFSALRVVFISLDSYSPINIQGDPQCHNFLFCDYLYAINKSAPKGSRILTMAAFRYYLRTDLFACSTKGSEYDLLQNAYLLGKNHFWEEVYRQGYSYIAYENNYSVRHLYIDLVPDTSNTPDWMQLEPIYGTPGDPTVAYKIIITSKPPIDLENTCVQENNVWLVKEIKN